MGSNRESANADGQVDADIDGASKPLAPACDQTPSAVPSATWANATGNLAGMSSECGNLTLVSTTTCSTRAIEGVAAKGLYAPLTSTFFIWHWDCGNVVLSDAIMSAGFPITAP